MFAFSIIALYYVIVLPNFSRAMLCWQSDKNNVIEDNT